jgi:hypothetical protein
MSTPPPLSVRPRRVLAWLLRPQGAGRWVLSRRDIRVRTAIWLGFVSLLAGLGCTSSGDDLFGQASAGSSTSSGAGGGTTSSSSAGGGSGVSAAAPVSAGVVATNAQYRLVFSVGGPAPGALSSGNETYRLNGGLVGQVGSPP